ncbi:uncharacterized protein EV420DRAFT_1140194 [Desarmillaria tabescens]|uniref:Uncharacterized protein n=1 Tax=Armillaria tabescens TaxID=1929756 RepID=A0AA39NC08_ARMTA|nr:uncharacterized protein EV420DRAFT_1140194 [Desarmillaria tabescens]KAK0462830.1 hypothetical protein EV420DRAFT_1140194 [Desarmillaria tabescens]
MSDSEPLFTLTMSSSSGYATNTLRRAYRAVFGRDPPPDERDDQILLWIKICSAVGVDHDLVRTIKRFFPALPDLSRFNVVGHLLDLPLALRTNVTAYKSIDTLEFMNHLQSSAELPGPELSTGDKSVLHRREQLVTAICHTLLSFVGFELASRHKNPTTNKLALSKETAQPTRILSYSIDSSWWFTLTVQITDFPDPDDPDVLVSIRWKHASVKSRTHPVCCVINFVDFFNEPTVFPSSGQFDRIEDVGFESSSSYVDFVQIMQEILLGPLWENIREKAPDVCTDQKSHEQYTKTAPHDGEEEQTRKRDTGSTAQDV